MQGGGGDAFAEGLPEPLRGEYLEEKSRRISKIRKEFSANFGRYSSRKLKGIMEDYCHKTTLNACISPFFPGGGLPAVMDYRHMRTSPLSELGAKNVDFLIYSESRKTAIFGEAKGSIEDPSKAISQYKKRMKAIEDNPDVVKRYAPEIERTEYVLAVPAAAAAGTLKSILRSSADIILWKVWPGYLSLASPQNMVPEDSRRVTHSDDALNTALSRRRTSPEFRIFFPENHIVAKMEVLFHLGAGGGRFGLHDVERIVRSQLDSVHENAAEGVAGNILRTGIEVGFVGRRPGGDYGLLFYRTDLGDLRDELRMRWIRHRHGQDMAAAVRDAVARLDAEFGKRADPGRPS